MVMELLEDCHGRKATIIMSQLAVTYWYDVMLSNGYGRFPWVGMDCFSQMETLPSPKPIKVLRILWRNPHS